MDSLSDRAMRVALLGYIPADDQHVIADMQGEIDRLGADNERLRALLETRDEFIVSRGLWNEFARTLLPVSATGGEDG